MTETVQGQRILIVDDDPAAIEMLRRLLGGEYEVAVATSGAETLAYAQGPMPPDLILLDVMAGMEGCGVCSRLKADAATRDIPVIIMAPKDREEEAIQGIESGAADYVTEPVAAPVLLARIRNHLRIKRFQETLEKDPEETGTESVDTEEIHSQIETTILEAVLDSENRNLELQQLIEQVNQELRDTTELHSQAQFRLLEKLSGLEKQYRELVEHLREVVFSCDKHGTLTFLNPAWTEALGYSTEESLGRSIGEFIFDEDRDKGLVLVAGKDRQHHELRFRHRNGDLAWFVASVRTAENEDKVGSLYNVTERRHAEDALKEAHDRLEVRVQERTAELSESNRQLAGEIEERTRAQEDLRQAFVTLKQAQADLLRAERMAVVGETSGRVAHEVLNPITSIFSRVEHNISHWTEFRETLASAQEIVQDWENEHRRGALAQYLATPNDDGTLYGDEDFQFLNGILKGAVAFQEQREDDLRFINKQLQRVIKIINTLRESVKTQRSVTTVKIAGPIAEAMEVLEDSLKKRHIVVRNAVPSGLPDVMADETEMIQVFTNLYRNAMQSIEERRQGGGTLDTHASVNDGRIEVRIRDTGTGIPEEARDSIFGFGFSTKGRDQGTGLGLGISRRFVRECGGDLLLEESAVGVGSTFLITIPVAKSADTGR